MNVLPEVIDYPFQTQKLNAQFGKGILVIVQSLILSHPEADYTSKAGIP